MAIENICEPFCPEILHKQNRLRSVLNVTDVFFHYILSLNTIVTSQDESTGLWSAKGGLVLLWEDQPYTLI